MKTMTALTASAVLAVTTLGACATTKSKTEGERISQSSVIENPEEMDNGYLILSDAQRQAVKSSNTFALNLFRTQMGMDSKVISPISATYLMGMLANGASGDTRAEIMKVLGLNEANLASLNEASQAIMGMASRMDKQTSINIANCIAVNQNIQLKADYVQAMKVAYAAEVGTHDFARPATVDYINNWCKRQTNNMIPSIIDQLDPDAPAVLMNAVYFNSTWAKPFDKALTKTENFRGYTRDIKRVSMMHQNDKFWYASRADYSAVSLPYGNGSYTMTIILPAENKSVDDVMRTLSPEGLDSLNNEMEQCIVDLKIPRFGTTTQTVLNKPLADLGAPSMFLAGKANFSHMTDASISVASILQKAKIEVSEEGTKAAAVTAAIMTTSALPNAEPRHVEFHANRPFVYMITNNASGAIFFMGQYAGE